MFKLYFDTNIIAYLQEPENYRDQPWYSQLPIIREYLNAHAEDVCVVYSPAHLADIRQQYVKGKEQAMTRLQFLSELTRDNCIAKYFSADEIRFETRDATEFFLSNLENDVELYQPGENRVDLVGLVERTGMLDMYRRVPFDYEKGRRLETIGIDLRRTKLEPTMYSFFLDFTEYMEGVFNNGHLVYKAMRNQMREDLGVSDKIAGQQDPLTMLKVLLPNSPLGKNLQEMMKEHFKSDPNNREDMIATDYMNLDLLGFKSDKLSENHGYMNVTTDAQHCFYASYCDIFVTNDTRAISKARAVFTYHNLETQVFNITDLYQWIGTSGESLPNVDHQGNI